MIGLKRSSVGRSIGSRNDAMKVWKGIQIERPYTKQPLKMDNGDELWVIEKQFWLKYKSEFQGMGFLPFDSWNATKNIPYMLENFKSH